MVASGMPASTSCLDLSRVRVRAARPDEVARCEQLLAEHHYLREAHVAGDRGWQIAECDQRPRHASEAILGRIGRHGINTRGIAATCWVAPSGIHDATFRTALIGILPRVRYSLHAALTRPIHPDFEMNMKRLIISLLAAGFLASAASAQLVYNITGTTGVKAKFTFTFNDSLDTVTVGIDNTIAGINGANGRITSFGFNTPFTATQLGIGGANVSFTENADGTWNKFVPFNLNPAPLQDFGVGLGTTEEGGGGGGIQFGETATFVFTFPDFVGTAGWGGADSLVVRFQSVLNSQGVPGDSDKVFGTPGDDPGGDLGVIPEPSTYGMLGALALLGMMVVRQMRRR